MNKIIVCKKGSVDAETKVSLKEAGHFIIETSNPKDIKVMDDFGSLLPMDELLKCALEAFGYGNDATCRMAFANIVRKKITDNLSKIQP